MANKKIYKNRLSLPIFDNKGMGNGNGIAYVPNIIRGGSAIPIGNNMFFMKGKSHNQGGIDIGKDLEVERNEVVQNGKFGTRVFSSVPFLRGVSPAERVLQGENPDAVFAAQENWKRINKINDDGSRKARKGKYITNPNVVQSDNTRVAPILNNTPKSKEIRQGDFIYTPKQLVVDDKKGFAWQPASRQVSQIPLERTYPEFDVFMLPRVVANYATSPILQLEKELNKGLRNIKIKNKTLTPTKYDVRDNVALYRANSSVIKNPNYKGERYGDNSGQYVGKWFTDDAEKINWYASNAAKKGEVPLAYKTTMPRYYAEKQKAAYKITNKNIEFEPEDYILEDGVKGLVGREFKGRPGTLEYITQTFPNDLRSKNLKNIFDIKNDIDFYNAANEFANKYGYETFDKTLVGNRKALEDAVKQMLNRHNTFYRGVVGDDATKRIAIDSPWKEGEGIWITPQADYAQLYGQVGKLQRPYKLSANRNNWFKDADFDYTFADDNVGLINPWQRNPKLYENTIIDKSVPHEIYAKDKLNFVDWIKDVKNAKGSNNIMNYKKFGGRKAALGLSLFRPNSFKVQELPIDNFLANSINKEIETPEVPTYVLKDDEKPVAKAQEYAKAAEALKAYPYGNKSSENTSVIDNTLFDDIKGERGFNKSEMRTIYKYLNDNGSNLSDYAKSAILATIAFESGANIRARNPRSSAKGYFQWLDDRYKFADNLSDEEERKLQLQKIINDMNPTDAFVNKAKDARGWTSVGERGYLKTAEDFRKAQDTLTAVDLITRGHIRPGNQDWEVAHRKMLADMFYNAIAKSKNRKAFGGENKVYTAPKWAQDSYKKHGKVIIGGEPLGIGLGVGRVGTFTGLMRNNLLRSAFRNFKKYGSRASTIIKDSYYDLTDALAKPFIRSEKAHKIFKKVRGIGYDTLFGDRRLDGTVKTGKGDFEFFSNLSRLPITFNETNNIINGEKQFGGMKLNIFKLGGLSRSKDYGSKDKPYPSVNKNDFAGGGRSYPIPTRADAVDALRLAGLHHRSDVRAKVYAKYPDLRKKAKLGKYAKITGSPANEQPSEPVRTNYVEKNNSSNDLGKTIGQGVAGSLIGGSTIFGLNRLAKNNKIPLSKNNPFVALNYDIVENPTNLERNYNYPKRVANRIKNSGVEELWDKRRLEDATKRINSVLNKYGDKIKVVNEPVAKEISSTQVYDVAKPKKYTPNLSEFSPKVKAGVQKVNKQNLNLARRLGTNIRNIGGILGKTLPGVALVDFVRNLFPSKQQEQEADKAWRRYKSPTGRVSEDYQLKFGGRKKALVGAGDYPIIYEEDHPLLNGFYHRRRLPFYQEDPLVSRFYNYGWSHNGIINPNIYTPGYRPGAEYSDYGIDLNYLNSLPYTDVNGVKGAHFDDYDYRRNTELVSPFNNPLSRFKKAKTISENTQTSKSTQRPAQASKMYSRKNNTPAVSSVAQKILDNAELAPYQNFSHPTLAEVAGRYPISERVGSSTSVTPISSSTGVQPNPADVEAVRSGNFKAIDNDRYVPIHTTTEDWVGLGANLLGSIGSYLGTRAMLNRYPMPSKPIPAIAQKLKTRFNINSALDQIREQAGTLGRMVDNNTASSRVAQARKQGISNNATASTNQQYNQKENIETQLINQDIMNRQRVGLYNNQVYNNWLSNRDAVRQYVANAKIGNFNNVLSGANQSIQDLLGRVESRDSLGRNLIFMQAAYPNVNWRNIFQNNRELARSFGFRFLNN